jgi:hypothetical protein
MKKALSIILAIALIANVVLLAFVRGYYVTFWIVLAIIGLLAFWAIPKIR